MLVELLRAFPRILREHSGVDRKVDPTLRLFLAISRSGFCCMLNDRNVRAVALDRLLCFSAAMWQQTGIRRAHGVLKSP
jgi:hypothetical protein